MFSSQLHIDIVLDHGPVIYPVFDPALLHTNPGVIQSNAPTLISSQNRSQGVQIFLHILHNSTAVDTELTVGYNEWWSSGLFRMSALVCWRDPRYARAKQRKSVDLLRSGQQPGTGDLGLPVHTRACNGTLANFHNHGEDYTGVNPL